MDIAKLSERLMGMDDATWARHSNALSGWSRITILPLFSLAIWSRVWIEWGALAPVLAVFIWTWVNPRLFRPPLHQRTWMTKGVLGERIWLARKSNPIPSHHVRVGWMLSLAASVGVFVLVYGLWQLELGWVMAGLAISMSAKLWFLDRMVWLLADVGDDCDQGDAPEG